MRPRPPVALFAYARPDHTRRTLDALARNNGSIDTDVTVFCDGARGDRDRDPVDAVARVLAGAKGFRSLRVIRRDRNIGLADNIIGGVNEILEMAGQVIVLEDDIETAPGFLDFMAAALDRYRDDRRVWHVSGWLYDIDRTGLPDYFFWPVMNCWGWATWADRWAHFDRDPERIDREWDAQRKRRFNLDGAHDFYDQIAGNLDGRMRTWAVFWYATIFENNGWCLTPTQPFLRNIGLDGTGENSGVAPAQQLDASRAFDGLPDEVGTCPEAVVRISRRLKPRGIRKLASNLSKRLRGAVVDS